MGELHHTTMSRFLISFALIAIAVTAVPTPMDAVVPEQDLVEHGPFDKCMNGCFGKRAANREACTEGCHGVCEKSHEPNKKGDEEQHEQAMGMMNKLIGECGKACDGAKECMAKKEKGGKPGPKCQKVKENCMPCIHSKMPKGPGMKPETLLETLLQQPGISAWNATKSATRLRTRQNVNGPKTHPKSNTKHCTSASGAVASRHISKGPARSR